MSRALLAAGGAAAFLSGTYVAVVLASKPKTCPGPLTEEQRLRAFTSKAPIYDAHVEQTEAGWLINIKGMRAELVKQANGVVLELAAGTGRNLEYYRPAGTVSPPVLASGGLSPAGGDAAAPGQTPPPAEATVAVAPPAGVTRLLLTDFAPAMLDVARARAATLQQPGRHIPLSALDLTVADAHALPLPDGCVDTVVDTFGLCSLRDPVQALREACRVLKPGGRLLLLEHGRSTWGVVNWLLDRHAGGHAHEWGCEWNRDITAVVKQAGCLRIHSVQRRHLGTTYVIVASPAPAGAQTGTARA